MFCSSCNTVIDHLWKSIVDKHLLSFLSQFTHRCLIVVPLSSNCLWSSPNVVFFFRNQVKQVLKSLEKVASCIIYRIIASSHRIICPKNFAQFLFFFFCYTLSEGLPQLQISNAQDNVKPHFQTPQSLSKIIRCASYFQLPSQCLETWPNLVFHVSHIISKD